MVKLTNIKDSPWRLTRHDLPGELGSEHNYNDGDSRQEYNPGTFFSPC